MKTFEIKNCEINVKRFYLPVSFDVKCACGKVSNIDLEQDYLSYPPPVVGESEKIYWYCDGCDREQDFNVNLKISVDVDCNYIVEA